jgi:hypothetical protein
MPITCTRCDGTGFLNIDLTPDELLRQFDSTGNHDLISNWIVMQDDCDVMLCDCCGDGDGWYGVPGEHYNQEDPPGRNGPYMYNGGLCKCH